jgi:hypothetical protein
MNAGLWLHRVPPRAGCKAVAALAGVQLTVDTPTKFDRTVCLVQMGVVLAVRGLLRTAVRPISGGLLIDLLSNATPSLRLLTACEESS